jgi:hypothetical protein
MKSTYPLAAVTAAIAASLMIGCGQQEPAATPQAPAPARPTTAVTEPAKTTALPAPPPAPAPAEAPKSQVQEITKVATDQFTALVNGFQSATPQTLALVQDAVEAIRKPDYGTALTLMQRAMGDTKLTPEQQNLLKKAVETVKGYVAKQAAQDPAKAASDLQKSLPFGK